MAELLLLKYKSLEGCLLPFILCDTLNNQMAWKNQKNIVICVLQLPGRSKV